MVKNSFFHYYNFGRYFENVPMVNRTFNSTGSFRFCMYFLLLFFAKKDEFSLIWLDYISGRFSNTNFHILHRRRRCFIAESWIEIWNNLKGFLYHICQVCPVYIGHNILFCTWKYRYSFKILYLAFVAIFLYKQFFDALLGHLVYNSPILQWNN